MKYFLDTEFVDDGKTLELLSIALVSEDGREFYVKNVEANFLAGGTWLQENVYSQLGLERLSILDLVKLTTLHQKITMTSGLLD